MASCLADFFKRAQVEPFVWGENDCALWVGSYIREVTGYDPASSLRGRYKTALGCMRLLKRHGGLEAVCADAMGQFPDGSHVGIFKQGGQVFAGVHHKGFAAIKTPQGLLMTKEPELVRGWDLW